MNTKKLCYKYIIYVNKTSNSTMNSFSESMWVHMKVIQKLNGTKVKLYYVKIYYKFNDCIV